MSCFDSSGDRIGQQRRIERFGNPIQWFCFVRPGTHSLIMPYFQGCARTIRPAFAGDRNLKSDLC